MKIPNQSKNLMNQIELSPSNSIIKFKNSLSINFNNQIQKNEFDNIIKLIKLENDTNMTKFDLYLNYFLRTYSKIKNETIDKLLSFLAQNNIHYKATIKCINTILDILIDNFQIINILNNMIPVLLNTLFQEENLKNLTAIHEISEFIGKLIKLGNKHISGLIEEIMDSIFQDIFKENSNESNLFYAYINLLNEIMKNSIYISFNNIIVKNNLGNFITLVEQTCCDKNEKIREMSAELTGNFINIFENRNSETKKNYIMDLYETLFNQYIENIKNNLNINSFSLVNGFLLILKKIYNLYPLLFTDDSLYTKLADNLMKFKKCGKNEQNIKLEFINFIPNLYFMNKKIFKKRYMKEIMRFSNEILYREKDVKLKYSLLEMLGILNYYEQENVNKYCSNLLLQLIEKLLTGKEFLNEQALKCISDLLNNKAGLLSQNIILMINIFNILPKIFKTPLNKSKVDFLISLINYFNYYSMENCSIIILSLNTISLILCNEEFKIDNFLAFNESSSTSLISSRLTEIKTNIIKDINKYLLDATLKDKNSSTYLDMVSNLLTLFANIRNNLFYKDMLIFYNYKLLPMIKCFNIDIKKQIINIVLCNFVTVDKNGENFSEFLIKNILDALFNVFILDDEPLPKDDLINIFVKKKVFIDILLKEKQLFFHKIINLLDSTFFNERKELIIAIISILEKNDNENKSAYKNYITNWVENIIFEIYSTKSKLYEEKSIIVLLYITKYFKHIFFDSIFAKILNICILIILRYEYKDIIVESTLKLVNELLSKEDNKRKNISLFNNILYILSLYYLKFGSINDYLSEYILNMLYNIIKRQNIDILEPIKFDIKDFIYYQSHVLNYNEKKMEEYYKKMLSIYKKLENINIIKMLYNILLQNENENNSIIILKILGLSTSFSFLELEKLNFELDELSNELEDVYNLENEKLKIKRYNKYTRNNIIINYTGVDLVGTKAFLSLMEILKYHSTKNLKIKIILNLNLIIESIPLNQPYYIDIIFPTILNILPQYESKYNNILIQNICLIIHKYKEKSKIYLDELILLIYDYIKEPYLEVLNTLFILLFENYENKMKKYYYRLIPQFISIIKQNIPERISYLNLLILIAKSIHIGPYIKLILENIKNLFLNSKDISVLNLLMDLIKEIMSKQDIYIYYPIIVTILLKKIDSSFHKKFLRKSSLTDNKLKTSLSKSIQKTEFNCTFFPKFFEILDVMSNKYRNYFFLFLPKIINCFIINGLSDNTDIHQKLKKYLILKNECTFMNAEGFKKKIYLDYCKINCYFAFNSFLHNPNKETQNKTNLNILDLEQYNDEEIDIDVMKKRSFSKVKLDIELINNRRSLLNNDIVIKSFENIKCTLEKDWMEWFRKVSNSVFEQTPSKFIYIFYILTQYYFNIKFDLYMHSFYSVYNNCTDNNKNFIILSLDKALTNSSTPGYIILSILNLIDFMEKKDISISFRKYDELGKIAYNCKAYTKALYFKEKGIEQDKISLENADNMIDLYYKLNVTENGYGLIKLIEQDKELEYLKNYNNKCIWYIKLHNFEKALDLINAKLVRKVETKNIKILKNYRNICLDGLCDWETILSEEDENRDINDDINIVKIERDSNILESEKYEIEDNVKNKLILLKSSLALGKWDKMFKYMNELNDIFLENDEQNDNFLNKSMSEKEIQKVKIDYIPYNDMINNKYFHFLKNEDLLFDLNVYAIIINIKKNNINIARKYINNCQSLLLNKLKVLIKESNHGNDSILKNQCLQQLEHYCNYKQYHNKNENYLNEMKAKFKSLNINLRKDPELYLKYISVNALIFPIEEEYYRYIDLAKVYRKTGKFIQCENILKQLKKKLNIKDNFTEDKNMIFDEKRITIELSYNKCLFEKGNINEAVDNSKYLIDLLNDNELRKYNKLNNNIKSKIYGNFAIYKINQIEKNKNSKKILRQKSENINGIFEKNINNYLLKHNLEIFLPKKEDSDKVKKVKFKIDEKFYLPNQIKKNNDEEDDNESKNNYQYYFIINEDNIDIINKYFILANELNNKNYKYWHNYAIFNYKCYKFINDYTKGKKELTKKYQQQIIDFAINAVNGLKYSLLISNKSKVRILQDCLRFIDIFFEIGSKDQYLLSLIESIINESNLEIFIGIIPQLTCRFDIKDEKVLDILINLLTNIFSEFPEILFFTLIATKKSKNKRNIAIADLIMKKAFKLNKSLYENNKEYETFVDELNKCSFLYHEEWIEVIETSARLYLNKDYDNMVKQLIKIHNKMNRNPENLYEINFYQQYGADLKEAEKKLNKYLIKQRLNYLKEAWEIYQNIYEKINKNYSKFQTISLQYISSKLFNFKDSNIIIPKLLNAYYYNAYDKNYLMNNKNKLIGNYKPVTIKQIDKYLYVLDSKQNPRKMSIIGSDNKEYIYLLKGQEDKRQDERVIQFIYIVNLIMAKDKSTSNLNLISTYSVIPLSHKSGLISWINDCDSLLELIKEYRSLQCKIQNIERSTINKLNPAYETSKLITKIEILSHIYDITKSDDLKKIIWIKSKDCESWFIRSTNFSRSSAVMSIVGYILGLGDRHFNNLLMNRKTGKIIHTNFGNCFEVAMNRDKFPEKVPFRLTRMIVRALGVTGVEGVYRMTCEKILFLLKNNKDSLLAILSALIHNPLISYKLLIPWIIKNQKNKFIFNNDIIISDNDKEKKNARNNYMERKSTRQEKRSSRISNYISGDKDDKDMDLEGKEERQIMEREQRQILNLFEENEDPDLDKIYKIIRLVINKIKDKLDGTDLNRVQLNVKEHVDILIKEATSIKNLALCYLGWCPFW